jgi:hypothetical protein
VGLLHQLAGFEGTHVRPHLHRSWDATGRLSRGVSAGHEDFSISYDEFEELIAHNVGRPRFAAQLGISGHPGRRSVARNDTAGSAGWSHACPVCRRRALARYWFDEFGAVITH